MKPLIIKKTKFEAIEPFFFSLLALVLMRETAIVEYESVTHAFDYGWNHADALLLVMFFICALRGIVYFIEGLFQVFTPAPVLSIYERAIACHLPYTNKKVFLSLYRVQDIQVKTQGKKSILQFDIDDAMYFSPVRINSGNINRQSWEIQVPRSYVERTEDLLEVINFRKEASYHVESVRENYMLILAVLLANKKKELQPFIQQIGKILYWLGQKEVEWTKVKREHERIIKLEEIVERAPLTHQQTLMMREIHAAIADAREKMEESMAQVDEKEKDEESD